MKRCPKCGESKPVAMFHRHRTREDGLQYDCKECQRATASKYRAENREAVLARKRKYRAENSEAGKEANRNWRRENEVRRSKYTKAWNKKFPERNRAHILVYRAIKRGKLKRGPCVKCGDAKAEGHHPDYDKPLEVTWLCRSCHQREHHHTGVPATPLNPPSNGKRAS